MSKITIVGIFIVLTLIVLISTAVGLLSNRQISDVAEELIPGDPPQDLDTPPVLVSKYKVKTSDHSQNQIYDDLLWMYMTDQIAYEALIQEITNILQNSFDLHPAFNEGVIRRMDFSDQSMYQMFIQDTKPRDASTMFLVIAGTPQNIVEIIYQGGWIASSWLSEDEQSIVCLVDGKESTIPFRRVGL